MADEETGLKFRSYQRATRKTRIYQQKIWYPVIGLAGEVGELCNKAKKVLRDGAGYWEPEQIDAIAGEVGDILWYLAALCDDLGLDLNKCAAQNIKKLKDRMERGAISGSGDDR